MYRQEALPLLVAISGGIGCGKSVVSRMLTVMGYSVYDCDSQARDIMDTSPEIVQAIAERVDAEAISFDGSIDRCRLAGIVFADADKLAALNAIVHGAVRRDIERWRADHRGCEVVFVETAILYQSGLDRMVDMVIEVMAPDEIRIERVQRRNGITAEQVQQRIDSQRIEVTTPHKLVRVIINDGDRAVLPQLLTILQQL